MYKISLFLNVNPQLLNERLSAVGFKFCDGGLVYESNECFFKIIPFGNGSIVNQQGYRIYFNNSIAGALYLFDLSVFPFQPKIIGIEYSLQKTQKISWKKYLRDQKFNLVNEVGIYSYGNVNMICESESKVTLQIRPTKPKGELKLNKSLEEINDLLEMINPMTLDIFSFGAI